MDMTIMDLDIKRVFPVENFPKSKNLQNVYLLLIQDIKVVQHMDIIYFLIIVTEIVVILLAYWTQDTMVV
jgi:hypothetical protein